MRKLLLAGIMLVWASVAFAQDKTISGKVTSSNNGSPLSGVGILIKGTNRVATTDENGIYKILAPANGTLSFSLNRFKTRTIEVGNRTIIDVQLKSRRRFRRSN